MCVRVCVLVSHRGRRKKGVTVILYGSKLVTIFPAVYVISYNYEIPKYFQKIAFLKH